jgi:hypothetical protein
VCEKSCLTELYKIEDIFVFIYRCNLFFFFAQIRWYDLKNMPSRCVPGCNSKYDSALKTTQDNCGMSIFINFLKMKNVNKHG